MKLTLNVKNAKLVVDGVVVPVKNGAATAHLADGTHQVEVTASGRAPLRERIEVSAERTALSLRLERAKGRTGGTRKTTGTGASTPTTHKDATIDPFK